MRYTLELLLLIGFFIGNAIYFKQAASRKSYGWAAFHFTATTSCLIGLIFTLMLV